MLGLVRVLTQADHVFRRKQREEPPKAAHGGWQRPHQVKEPASAAFGILASLDVVVREGMKHLARRIAAPGQKVALERGPEPARVVGEQVSHGSISGGRSGAARPDGDEEAVSQAGHDDVRFIERTRDQVTDVANVNRLELLSRGTQRYVGALEFLRGEGVERLVVFERRVDEAMSQRSGMWTSTAGMTTFWIPSCCTRTATSKPTGLPGPLRAYDKAALAPSGHMVAASGDGQNSAELVVFGLSTAPSEIYRAEVSQWPSALLWLNENPPALLLGFDDGSIKLCTANKTADGQALRMEDAYTFDRTDCDSPTTCTHLGQSTDGQWLGACWEGPELSGAVTIWRSTGRSLSHHGFDGAFKLHHEFVTPPYTWSMAFVHTTAKDVTVATTGSSFDVRLWEGSSGREIGRLVGHYDVVRQCLPLHPGLLVTASDDRTLRNLGCRAARGIVRAPRKPGAHAHGCRQ